MDIEEYRQALPAGFRDLVVTPGQQEYDDATTPRNSSGHQAPAGVLLASSSDHVRAAVRAAVAVGGRVAPQATGHGAAGDLGDDVVLIDTSRIATVEIDADRRTARVGAGAVFRAINEAAFQHGLLALAGTAPDVAVVGYTALGGVGWLTRPYGLASASLLAVDVVDGTGRHRRADAEHDQDLLWAFRGGEGAGIATSMEVTLHAAEDLQAGYLLWPVEAAEAVLPAWGAALSSFHPALSSSIGVLHAPDAPAIPEDLKGKVVVHLSAATVAGEEGAASLRALLRDLPEPSIDTFGPSDAERLSAIHLDPPVPTPAQGEGRWLTAEAGAHVLVILTAAGTDPDGALVEIELRHVAAPPSTVPGALTSTPGALLLHATGPAPTPEARSAVHAALATVRGVTDPFDAGLSASAFRDGRPEDADALPRDAHDRAEAIRAAVDPHGVVVRTRTAAAS